jgi:hypothetical protein
MAKKYYKKLLFVFLLIAAVFIIPFRGGYTDICRNLEQCDLPTSGASWHQAGICQPPTKTDNLNLIKRSTEQIIKQTMWSVNDRFSNDPSRNTCFGAAYNVYFPETPKNSKLWIKVGLDGNRQLGEDFYLIVSEKNTLEKIFSWYVPDNGSSGQVWRGGVLDRDLKAGYYDIWVTAGPRENGSVHIGDVGPIRLTRFDYLLSNSGDLNVVQGESAANTITAVLNFPFSETPPAAGTISFSASGLPSGASISFSNGKDCFIRSGGTNCSKSLTIATSDNTPVGTYQITVKGLVSGSSLLERKTSFLLKVNAPANRFIQVDLKANGSNGPIELNYRSYVVLSWTSENADYCWAWGDWSGRKSTAGSQSVYLDSVRTYNFILRCQNNSQSNSESDSVVVKAKPLPPKVITKPAVVTY